MANGSGTTGDVQSRFLEMKSVQPYSTTDEYIYAMKEDLADWLSTMYPEWRPIAAESFLECLGKHCVTFVDLSLFAKASVQLEEKIKRFRLDETENIVRPLSQKSG